MAGDPLSPSDDPASTKPETPAEARARMLREQLARNHAIYRARAQGVANQAAAAEIIARASPKSAAYRRRDKSRSDGAALPLAARVASGQTFYGKIWETDLDGIERKPFIDRPWLTRAQAVIAKFRPPELRKEIKAASLITVSLGLARLWYEGKSVCHHSWSYIAVRAGVCRDTVRRALIWLRRHGLLVGTNVLVRPERPDDTAGPEERVANVYLPKLPEEGPPELSLPTLDSPAVKASAIDRVKAEIGFIAGRCRDAVVSAWGINIRRAPIRRGERHAPA